MLAFLADLFNFKSLEKDEPFSWNRHCKINTWASNKVYAKGRKFTETFTIKPSFKLKIYLMKTFEKLIKIGF